MRATKGRAGVVGNRRTGLPAPTLFTQPSREKDPGIVASDFRYQARPLSSQSDFIKGQREHVPGRLHVRLHGCPQITEVTLDDGLCYHRRGTPPGITNSLLKNRHAALGLLQHLATVESLRRAARIESPAGRKTLRSLARMARPLYA